MRKSYQPVGWNERRLFRDGINIVRQRQGHHVSFQAVDDGPCLFARPSMGLLDRHLLTRLGQPVLGKGRVKLLVQLPGWVIGHIQNDHRFGSLNGWNPQGKSRQKYHDRSQQFDPHNMLLSLLSRYQRWTFQSLILGLEVMANA
jgi:hypothetical protein